MTAKRKNQTTQEEVLDSSETPSTENNENEISSEVETEVQTHKKKSPSIIDRAKRKMKEITTDDDDEPREKKSKGAPGYIRPQQREELATLVSSVFVMAIAASNIPDEIAPDTDEINGISEHLIKILARHVDLSKKLTGDVLDIIGIVAITSGWYARVAPILSEMREKKKKKTGNTLSVTQPNNDPEKAVSSFLDVAALSGGEGPAQ